jgi:pyruvate formate lyase activating enzyme
LIAPRGTQQIPWTNITAFLERRRGLLDAVVFSGGEPTLQSALPDAARQVRDLGFRIGLHTAGPYPRRLAALLPLLDWVALDIKALPNDYPAITGVPGSGRRGWHSLKILQESGVAFEVRTTVMPGWTKTDLARLVETLAHAKVRRYALQACHVQHALEAPGLAPHQPLAELTAGIDSKAFDTFTRRG